jgi:hypothetical protein
LKDLWILNIIAHKVLDGLQRIKSECMPLGTNCLEIQFVNMFPQFITGAEMRFLMKFETILKSCTRIGTGNSIALITSISAISESDG